jgi:phosphonate transport system substrate-binding protein
MQTITITSLQAPNADPFIADLADYLAWQLHRPVKFICDPPWQERERLLDAGEIQIGWICGLPYTWKADQRPPLVELLAAPVMSALRYQNTPVYFSDVVVLKSAPFRRFLDLRSARWAYNEPHSHSGYNVTRWRLEQLEEYRGFFGEVIEAGSHQNALQMVLEGRIDAAAIDSTVLETEIRARPELTDSLRVLEVFGPSPIPPLVTTRSLPGELRQPLQQALLEMHRQPEGQPVLARHHLRRFALVTDADYDPIREMERLAHKVEL